MTNDWDLLKPGLYELRMINGDLVRADVGQLSGVGPWWAKHGGTPTDDWRDVADARRLGDSAPNAATWETKR
jgi:hypothetical protein